MKALGSKRPVIVLAALSVAACAVAAYFFSTTAILRIKIAFAEDQTAFFDEMRKRADAQDIDAAKACLESVVEYYPSGTKQTHDSPLDLIVERARANAAAEIIDLLRTNTSEDYGAYPQKWIEAFDNADRTK